MKKRSRQARRPVGRNKLASGVSFAWCRPVLAFETLERRLLLTVSSVVSSGRTTDAVSHAIVEPIDLNGPAVGSGFTSTYLTGNGPVLIVDSGAATITYDANPSLTSLSVSLSNLQVGDVLAASTSGTSIVANYSAGTLILSGADSPTHYQQVLRTITYKNNTLGGPYLPSITATFTVYDAQGAWNDSAVATISIRTVRRLKDIAPGTASSDPDTFVDVGGRAFFIANDATSGDELWTSDGTSGGTFRVKDIRPGASTSSPRYLTNVNGTLFLGANDGVNGGALWKSDGTTDGTVLVKDIQPGAAGQFGPLTLTNVGGTLFFLGNDGTSGYELWKSDGTTDGTVLVTEIQPGPADSRPVLLTNVGGVLFFIADHGSTGDELWKSDGTSDGTVLVKAFPDVGPLRYPSRLTNVAGTLFFRANNGTNGDELWKSDGTSEGTVLVKDIRPGSSGSSPIFFTNMDGTLFFVATDGMNGYELWKSDGTSDGTTLVKDILPGSASGFPEYLTDVGGTLFFRANDGTHGYELWKSDGTSDGTTLVKDIQAGASTSIPKFLANLAGTLFFQGTTGAGNELWKSDGTSNGTVLAADVNPGTSSSAPRFLTNIGGALFFNAFEPTRGIEAWVAGFPAYPSIVKTDLFYKDSSKWHVNNPATFSDDNAIASDKTAYLPGSGTSSFSAVSSYDKGINGLMIDLSGVHGAITVNDFQFKRGNNNSPSMWSAATAPTLVTTRAGAGIDGTDRIELFWDNNQSVKKQWLEVIVEGNDALGGFNTNTGLVSSYVFYFGSAVGDAGIGNSGGFQTSSADEINARNHPKSVSNPATRSDVNDFNRNGLVDSADQIIARNNPTGLGNQLKLLVLGAGGPFAPQSSDADADQPETVLRGSGDAGVASALSTVSPSDVSRAARAAAQLSEMLAEDRRAIQLLALADSPAFQAGTSVKLSRERDDPSTIDLDDALVDVLAADLLLR